MLHTVLQDPSVIAVATTLRDLAFVVHAGAIIAFALMAALSARFGGPPTAQVLRVYRGFGPGLGITMGVAFFGGVLLHYGAVGSLFEWGASVDTGGRAGVAARAVFLLAWASNIQLEVWSLEPLRKLDPLGTGEAVDPSALERATLRVTRHLGIQATLFVVVVILTRIGAG